MLLLVRKFNNLLKVSKLVITSGKFNNLLKLNKLVCYY